MAKRKHMQCKLCPEKIFGPSWKMAQHVRLKHPKDRSARFDVPEDAAPDPWKLLMKFIDNPTDTTQADARQALIELHARAVGEQPELHTLEDMLAHRTQLTAALHSISHAIDQKLVDLGLEWSAPENDPMRETAEALDNYHREKSA